MPLMVNNFAKPKSVCTARVEGFNRCAAGMRWHPILFPVFLPCLHLETMRRVTHKAQGPASRPGPRLACSPSRNAGGQFARDAASPHKGLIGRKQVETYFNARPTAANVVPMAKATASARPQSLCQNEKPA